MGGRKKKQGKPKETPSPSFEDRLNAYLNAVARLVMQSRARPGGAIKFGRDAMHVLLVEAADTAQMSGTNGYMSSATYAVIAAMMTAGHWDDEKPGDKKAPTPSEEPPPEGADKPADKPKK